MRRPNACLYRQSRQQHNGQAAEPSPQGTTKAKVVSDNTWLIAPYPDRESNSDLLFRRELFYPLNYQGNLKFALKGGAKVLQFADKTKNMWNENAEEPLVCSLDSCPLYSQRYIGKSLTEVGLANIYATTHCRCRKKSHQFWMEIDTILPKDCIYLWAKSI